jgi:hypothetical protein
MSPELRSYLRAALIGLNRERTRLEHGYLIGKRTHATPIYVFVLPHQVVVVDAKRRLATGKPKVLRTFPEITTVAELGTEIGKIADELQAAADQRLLPPCRALVTREHWTFPLRYRMALEQGRYVAYVKAQMLGAIA